MAFFSFKIMTFTRIGHFYYVSNSFQQYYVATHYEFKFIGKPYSIYYLDYLLEYNFHMSLRKEIK